MLRMGDPHLLHPDAEHRGSTRLCALLCSRLTYDCVPGHESNIIMMFADDIIVLGLIGKNNERAYREEVEHLVAWCGDNNLTLNITKTKELMVYYRRYRHTHRPHHLAPLWKEIQVSTLERAG